MQISCSREARCDAKLHIGQIVNGRQAEPKGANGSGYMILFWEWGQDFTVEPWLTWNSMWTKLASDSQKSACLWLLSAGEKVYSEHTFYERSCF